MCLPSPDFAAQAVLLPSQVDLQGEEIIEEHDNHLEVRELKLCGENAVRSAPWSASQASPPKSGARGKPSPLQSKVLGDSV